MKKGRVFGEAEVVSDELTMATRGDGEDAVEWAELAVLFIWLQNNGCSRFAEAYKNV